MLRQVLEILIDARAISNLRRNVRVFFFQVNASGP